MKTPLYSTLAIAVLSLLLSPTASAAKPVSIQYQEDIIINNELIFSHFKVKCSDGRVADISAWDRQTKWCVGKGRQDDCGKTQLSTAKKVCR